MEGRNVPDLGSIPFQGVSPRVPQASLGISPATHPRREVVGDTPTPPARALRLCTPEEMRELPGSPVGWARVQDEPPTHPLGGIPKVMQAQALARMVLVTRLTLLGGCVGHEGAYALAGDDALEAALGEEVEDDDGEAVLHAEGECRRVHYPQSQVEGLPVG